MKRGDFLKLGLLPLAAAGAEMAKKLDPDGDPMREVDGQLVVNGDNVTIQNVTFRTGPAKAAIRFSGSQRAVVHNNIVVSG